jgi:hypothetical protein
MSFFIRKNTDEEKILLNAVKTLKPENRFLIIPKSKVSNHSAFKSHCSQFLGVNCGELKDSYKILLTEKGKQYLNELNNRT